MCRDGCRDLRLRCFDFESEVSDGQGHDIGAGVSEANGPFS